MKNLFNLISINSGRIAGTVTASNLQEASNILASKGYDVLDDYFVESSEKTQLRNKQNINQRLIYNEAI